MLLQLLQLLLHCCFGPVCAGPLQGVLWSRTVTPVHNFTAPRQWGVWGTHDSSTWNESFKMPLVSQRKIKIKMNAVIPFRTSCIETGRSVSPRGRSGQFLALRRVWSSSLVLQKKNQTCAALWGVVDGEGEGEGHHKDPTGLARRTSTSRQERPIISTQTADETRKKNYTVIDFTGSTIVQKFVTKEEFSSLWGHEGTRHRGRQTHTADSM